MASTDDEKQVAKEKDAANLKLRLFLLAEQVDMLQAKMQWEVEAFSLRHQDNGVE